MSQTISRMYDSPERAAGAVAALKDEDYSDVHMVAGATESSIDSIVASIMKGNVLKSDAKVYAKGVNRGGSLVTVHAPFGAAAKAMRVLDRFDPIDSGITETEDRMMAWDEAAPMSSILQMPVLIDHAAPFSAFWNLPSLVSSSCSLSSLFGMPLLTKSDSRSSSFGLPLLSRNPAPLSSMLHIPTLSRRQ
jgi:hypothetical protein